MDKMGQFLIQMSELEKLNQEANPDTIKEPQKSSNGLEKLALSTGQPEFLCNNNASCCGPSLSYEPATDSDSEIRINRAFDILFQEVLRIRQANHPHEINRHLRPGFDGPTGRRTDDQDAVDCGE
jgi:hypothetical protein